MFESTAGVPILIFSILRVCKIKSLKKSFEIVNSKVKIITEKYLSDFNNIKKVNLRTVFLKPKYGDASGVRGAARLVITATY